MSDKKVIFITTTNRNSELGGQELYILKLVKILEKKNISYKIFTPYSIGIKNEIIISSKKKDFFNAAGMIKKELPNECDKLIIHSNDCYSNLIAYFISYRNKYRFFVSAIIHDVYVSEYMPLILKLKKNFYELIDKIILKKFDAVIIYSGYLKEKINFKKKVFFPAGIEEEASKKEDSKRIGKIGWIGRQDINKKGIDIFFDIINNFEKSDNDFEYHIAGLNDKNILKKYYKGLPEKIKWYGYIPEKAEFWNSIDALIVSSRFEGLGLVFLEAVNRNIPVFASDIPSFMRIKNSLDYPIELFELSNAGILKVSGEILKFNKCAFDSKKYSEKCRSLYSFENLEKKYLNFIENVI